MSSDARFDIRIPIGALFTLLGLILAIYGVATWSDATLYARSESVVINFWWGVIMVIFGGLMLYFGTRAPTHPRDSASGFATEEREHRLGLEKER
jgi:uncharacterized membrane protein